MSAPAHADRSVFSSLIIEWYSMNRRKFPFRETSDPYHVLVAEMMLRQTTARQVANVFPDFINRYPTAEALANADAEAVWRVVKPLGLRSRAGTLVGMARMIMEKHSGRVPSTLDDLKAIPGVGDYAGGCVVAFCFRQRVPLIDVNTERVISRALLRCTQRDASTIAKELIAHEYIAALGEGSPRDFQCALIDLSHAFCRPADPRCDLCPVKGACRHFTVTHGSPTEAKLGVSTDL